MKRNELLFSPDAAPSAPAPVAAPEKTIDTQPTVVALTKNEVSLEFVEWAEEKGPSKGAAFLALKTPLTVDQWIKVTNVEWVLKLIASKAKKVLKGLYDTSLNADKQIDLAKFKAAVEQETFTTETMKDLKEKLNAVLTELLAVDGSTQEGYAKSQGLIADMKAIKQKIDMKSRVKDEDEEDDAPAAPAATT